MVHFKMKKKTALKKLMQAYCARESLQMDQMRFLFSGNKVRENQTPEVLEMEDGDVIDAVLMMQSFQAAPQNVVALPATISEMAADHEYINLKVEGQVLCDDCQRARQQACASRRCICP